MKTIKHVFLVFAFASLISSCKNETKEDAANAATTETETEATGRSGQAFITDDESTPTVLSIAIGSKDHTTLVAAVQAAQLENVLVKEAE